MVPPVTAGDLKWPIRSDWSVVVYPPGGGFFLNISTLPVSPRYGPWDGLGTARGTVTGRSRDGLGEEEEEKTRCWECVITGEGK